MGMGKTSIIAYHGCLFVYLGKTRALSTFLYIAEGFSIRKRANNTIFVESQTYVARGLARALCVVYILFVSLNTTCMHVCVRVHINS